MQPPARLDLSKIQGENLPNPKVMMRIPNGHDNFQRWVHTRSNIKVSGCCTILVRLKPAGRANSKATQWQMSIFGSKYKSSQRGPLTGSYHMVIIPTLGLEVQTESSVIFIRLLFPTLIQVW